MLEVPAEILNSLSLLSGATQQHYLLSALFSHCLDKAALTDWSGSNLSGVSRDLEMKYFHNL